MAANSSKTPFGSCVPVIRLIRPPSGFGVSEVIFNNSSPLVFTTQKCPEI